MVAGVEGEKQLIKEFRIILHGRFMGLFMNDTTKYSSTFRKYSYLNGVLLLSTTESHFNIVCIVCIRTLYYFFFALCFRMKENFS